LAGCAGRDGAAPSGTGEQGVLRERRRVRRSYAGRTDPLRTGEIPQILALSVPIRNGAGLAVGGRMTLRLFGLGVLIVVTACASGNQDDVAGDPHLAGDGGTSAGSTGSIGAGAEPSTDGSVGSACDDGKRNGIESDVDCGGACAPCDNGRDCTDDADCSSGSCATGTCAEPSCTDGKKNGNETAADCGGGTCAGCGDGQECSEASDCASGLCGDDVCCTKTTYTLSTGFTASGGQICCDGGDERLSAVDCGDGDDHWVTPTGANCAQAFEGSDNNGGPCATVTCTKLSCGAMDAGIDAAPPR
jgi:hypothetical protein